VLERIIEMVSNLGALGLAAAASLLAFAETGIGLDLVVPGEAGMVVVGAAAEEGGHPIWVVILGAAVGATLGDCVSYAIGRRWGLRILERFDLTRRRLVPAVRRAEPFFERRGGLAVFLGRWVGALRAVVPVVAGTAKMPFPRFLAWNVAASIAWSTAVVGAGYAFGMPAARLVDSAGLWVYAGVVGVLLGVWVWRRSRASRSPDGSTAHGSGSSTVGSDAIPPVASTSGATGRGAGAAHRAGPGGPGDPLAAARRSALEDGAQARGAGRR